MTSSRTRTAGAGIAAGALLLTLLLSAGGALQRLEWITYDQRMRQFSADSALADEIAIILIDEPSLKAMSPLVGRYPWPRSVYAELIEYLALGGAKAIVFDILYSEAEPNSDSDAKLAKATADAGNVIHAAQLVRDPEISSPFLLPADLPDRFGLALDRSSFADNNDFILPIPALYRTAAAIGTVGMEPDADGVFRRVPLLQRYGDQLYPALSLAPLLLGSKAALKSVDGQLLLNGRPVPMDDNRYLVKMVGRQNAFSISGIFASIVAIRSGDMEHLVVSPDEFAGKIVFIGASAIGLEDNKATPVSAKMPGVFIHASVTSDLLTGRSLAYAPPGYAVLAALLLALFTVVAILGIPLLSLQVILPPLAAAGYTGIAYWQFAQGRVIYLVPPIVAALLSYLGAFAYRAFTEGRGRRQVRKMLGQYVSPAMLAEVLNDADEQLRAQVGKREHLTILFADIRGFTSLSEQLRAEQVVELLNVHFSRMSEIIFHHRGTLDKFIGDAIMAFWGAPIRVTDHAVRAVTAAIEMERGITEVNAALAQRGYPPIAIGLGINTGDVVLGNIGSERKLDYTVIGDPVNLASRLEGLCKSYGCPVVISEYTFQQLGGDFPCATLDLVRVKGKQQPIRIYWPLALPTDPPEQLVEAWEMARCSATAFEHYIARDFAVAERAYRRLPECRLRELFLRRIADYRQAPPAGDWDGVFTLTTK